MTELENFKILLASRVLQLWTPNAEYLSMRPIGNGVSLFNGETFVTGIPEGSAAELAEMMVQSLQRKPLIDPDDDQSDMFEDAYCTVPEALLRLKQRGVIVSHSALVQAARKGAIESRKFGRALMLDKISVDAYTPRSYAGKPGRVHTPNPTGRNGRKKIENIL